MKHRIGFIALICIFALCISACQTATPPDVSAPDAETSANSEAESQASADTDSSIDTEEDTAVDSSVSEDSSFSDTAVSEDNAESSEAAGPVDSEVPATSGTLSTSGKPGNSTTATKKPTSSVAGQVSIFTLPPTTTTKAPDPTTAHKGQNDQTVATTTTTTTRATIPTTTQAPVPMTPLQPLSESEYYGLTYLKSQPNGAALADTYHRMAEGIEDMDTTIELDYQNHPISDVELQKVFHCYRNDYPQHFWLGGKYSYTFTTKGGKKTIREWKTSDYLFSASEKTKAEKAFKKAANEILSKVSGSLSEYQRELALHDALVNLCTYDANSGDSGHSAYGALVNGKAVCEGYARAMQYLLYQAGIPCLIVEGHSHGEPHAWNMVQIDKQWYHTDPTWDDPISDTPMLYHAYFNVTEEQICEDHTIEQADYTVPKATATKANYHRVNDTAVDSVSVPQMVELFKGNNTVTFYVSSGDVADFIQKLFNSLGLIMQLSGRSGGVAATCCGREVQITILE